MVILDDDIETGDDDYFDDDVCCPECYSSDVDISTDSNYTHICNVCGKFFD